MLDILKEVSKNLPNLIFEAAKSGQINTMYIDYHKPYVSRIWFPYKDVRVFLHKIEPCNESSEALYHPHKWDSAMEILVGQYEMGIGHSSTNETPKTDCKLILWSGTMYEMIEKDAWHYVNPIDGPAYTLMVTGKLNNREMPIEPKYVFRQLDKEELYDLLEVVLTGSLYDHHAIAEMILLKK